MINFNSASQLSILFFGGHIEEECQIPILNLFGIQETYKSGEKRGQIKTKKGIKKIYIKGLGLKPKKIWSTKKEGIYQTNEKILKEIKNKQQINKDAQKIAELMLKIREKEKLLSTYYEGWNKFMHTDSCIHPHFNHCGYEHNNGGIGGGTGTGRLSSNKPNVQNVPRSK